MSSNRLAFAFVALLLSPATLAAQYCRGAGGESVSAAQTLTHGAAVLPSDTTAPIRVSHCAPIGVY